MAIALMIAGLVVAATAIGIVDVFASSAALLPASQEEKTQDSGEVAELARGNRLSVAVLETRFENIEKTVEEIKTDVKAMKDSTDVAGESAYETIILAIGALMVGKEGLAIYQRARG